METLKLRLFTTNDCNLNCSYCIIDHSCPRYGNLQVILDSIAWGIYNFPDRVYSLLFTGGGEPLLCYNLISDTIKQSLKRWPKAIFNYQLTTNGTLLDEKWITLFTKYKDLISVSLSLDGTQSTQDSQRDSSFSSLDLATWSCLASSVSMTVTSDSIRDLSTNFKYIAAQGFTQIGISVDYTGLHKDAALLYDKELAKISQFILQTEKTLKPVHFDLFLRSSKLLDKQVISKCDCDEVNFSIDEKGDMVGCHIEALSFIDRPEIAGYFKDLQVRNIYKDKTWVFQNRDYSCQYYKILDTCKSCIAFRTCTRCKELFLFANKEDVCRVIRIEHKHIVDYLDKFEAIKKEEALMHTKLQTADIFLTDRCNLYCDYCYEKKGTTDMSSETLDKVINFSFTQSNATEPLTFWFFGGEPMLVSNLLLEACNKVVERQIAEKRKVSTVILTNGTIFDSRIAEFIRDKPCIGLQISLDGIKEVHDNHRKFKHGKGSFDIVDNNISRYLEYKPDLHIRMTIMPDVVESLSNSIAYILDKGVRSFAIMPVHEVEWSEKAIKSYREEFKKITAMVVKLIQNKERVYFSTLRLNSPNQPIQDIPCGAGQYFFAIDTVGDIYPCHRFKYLTKEDGSSFKIGNIINGLNIDKLTSFTGLKTVDIAGCKECTAVNCDRCIAMNWLMNKDFKNSARVGYCSLPTIHDEAAIRVYNYLSELYVWLASERKLSEYPFVQDLIEKNEYGQIG